MAVHRGQIGGGGIWGPAIDPSPDFGGVFGMPPWPPQPDPAPPWHVLLDKSKIAVIRVRQIDLRVQQLESQLDLLKLERQILKEEYKIK